MPRSVPKRSVRALVVSLAAAVPLAATPPGAPESTRRMAERLARIASASDPRAQPFMNGARARLIEQALAEGEEATPPVLLALAQERLNSGRTLDAIETLAGLDRTLTLAAGGSGAARLGDDLITLRMQQAVAQLRRAEEENCSAHHNPLSCLLPVRGSGVHTERRGARAAFDLLAEVLALRPDHLEARWLFNVAAMALGEYPEGIPSRWRLSAELFDSEHEIGRFPDVAEESGLAVDDLAGGTIADDFDGDGDLDIVASSMGLTSPLRYFENRSDGTFVERTERAGLTGLTGGLNVVQTDYDNDGALDVLVLRGAWLGTQGRYPNSLLRNDGHGSFTDVTEAAGMLSFHPTQTAVWLDFDADGWLDVFIGNEATQGDPHPSELYHNNGDGTFTECAHEAGVATFGFVKAATSGDFNNDSRPDLYLSLKGEPNRLYRNDGPFASPAEGRAQGACGWRFTDVAAAAGVTGPIHSFPTWFWDYDNDGWEDLFVSGYMLQDAGDVAADYLGLPHRGELPRLYHNEGDGTFSDRTRPARLDRLLLTMGSNYGDLDDGWLDFYAGTGNPSLGMLIPNRMFRNDGGRRFQDVTTSGGFGHLQKGHGVSFADLDNDGDQDVYIVVGGAFEADHYRNALFENPGHGNHWVALTLEGVRSNRPGIGARVKVVVAAPDGERAIHRTVRSGGSFGASPLTQHIGLGSASRILRVEIQWPAGGPPQVLDELRMNRHHVVREGEPRAAARRLHGFRLGGRRRR